jgi:uncharacterized tellurite resistance protein B-like protein
MTKSGYNGDDQRREQTEVHVLGEYMAMTGNIDPTNTGDVGELLDLSSIPEAQRVAFYGAMLAVAAADGTWGQDELDLIFQNIHTDDLSDRSRNTIWEYLVDTPPLTDCLASFTTSHEHVRCAVMVYLIEIAIADRALAAGEDEALLQARACLRISQKQIDAIERYICNVGLIRARPRDYQEGTASLKYKYGLGLVAGVSLPAIALYFSSTIGGVSMAQIFSGLARPGYGRAMLLGAGAAALIGTAAGLTGCWLYTRYQRKRLPLARERRRRAQSAVRNLQDAVGYLTAKAKLHAAVGAPSELGNNTSMVFAERLWILKQMLARQQSGTAAPPPGPAPLDWL